MRGTSSLRSDLDGLIRDSLSREASALGIGAHAFLDREALLPFIKRYPEASHRYGLDRAGLVMTATLAFGNGLGLAGEARLTSTPSKAGPILAKIGRFARANWYAELVDRLRLCAKAARDALIEAGANPGSAGDWHRLANSGLPERPLALASGLGSPGRSGLLLVPGAGPGVILGLLLVPMTACGLDEAVASEQILRSFDDTSTRFPLPGADCGSCQACVEACPTGALSFGGNFEKEICIQYWSSRGGILPERVSSAWTDVLYGCDLCTISCPRFSAKSSIVPSRGLLGEALPAEEIVSATDVELRGRLRGTALGLGWISPAALRRNAGIVIERAHAGSRGP